MQLRRVIVQLDEGRRMVLHREGGMATEVYRDGFGWCVADDEFGNDSEMAAVLDEAAGMAQSVALNVLTAWTPEDILRNEA